MPTAENAKLMYEAGQTSYAMAAMTDSGDRTTFTTAAAPLSRRSGYAPVIRPNGVVTGGVVSVAASGSDDVVDVTALTCNLAGVVTSVSASTDESVTRPATNVAKVCSITVTSAGAITEVAGTDGATTTFSETRGAAGGPPLIPTGSIELAQVRMTSSTSAAITADEIFAVPNVHREPANYPVITERDYTNGEVTFADALMAAHTGPVAKAVYASYATPIFAEVPNATDYVPSETSHSVNSVQVYNATIGSTSSTLNQGSFTTYGDDNVTDGLVGEKNQILWFKFFPDRDKTPFIYDQGTLGVSRTFSPSGSLAASCTISAETAATEHAS